MNLTSPMDHRLPKVDLREGFRWRGKFPLSAAAVWLLMMLAGGGATDAQSADAAVVKERVVAKVNGMPIYASDLDAMVKAQERVLLSQFAGDSARLRKEMVDAKSNALNALIDFQLLEDEFFRLGGVISKEDIEEDLVKATNESFKGDRRALFAELDAMGISYEKYRELRERMIIVGAVRSRIAANVEVTDKMVREYYEKNLQRWRGAEAVKFHTLTIFNKTANDHTLAESLRTRLVKGGDFAEIARENSKDSRADDGGAWPWTNISDINEKVGMALEKTHKGEVSEVLEESGTFVILRVDDRREADPKPFESVKEEVRRSLIEELSREQVEKRMTRLREAADIQKMGPV